MISPAQPLSAAPPGVTKLPRLAPLQVRGAARQPRVRAREDERVAGKESDARAMSAGVGVKERADCGFALCLWERMVRIEVRTSAYRFCERSTARTELYCTLHDNILPYTR